MGARPSTPTPASSANSPRSNPSLASGGPLGGPSAIGIGSMGATGSFRQNGSTRNTSGRHYVNQSAASGSGAPEARFRARSLTNVINSNGQPIGHGLGLAALGLGQGSFAISGSSPDSESSSDEIAGRVTNSLPTIRLAFPGFKCPVCSKTILSDDVECHLVMCLTKPRISYNEDVLTEDKGECVICLDDLSQGNIIARLPCLCIYHKNCIDAWFKVNRSCPEHPSDD